VKITEKPKGDRESKKQSAALNPAPQGWNRSQSHNHKVSQANLATTALKTYTQGIPTLLISFKPSAGICCDNVFFCMAG
jgi:hypothetical protein